MNQENSYSHILYITYIINHTSILTAPDNVEVFTNSSRTLTVLWDSPAGEEPFNYTINWFPEDGTVQYSDDLNAAYLIDLEPCTTYNITVTAFSAGGIESPPSDEVHGETDSEGRRYSIA